MDELIIEIPFNKQNYLNECEIHKQLAYGTYKRQINGFTIITVMLVIISLLLYSVDGIFSLLLNVTISAVILLVFIISSYRKSIKTFNKAVENNIKCMLDNNSNIVYHFNVDYFSDSDYSKKVEYKWLCFKAFGHYQNFFVLLPAIGPNYFLINKNDLDATQIKSVEAFLKLKLPEEKIKDM